MWRCQVCGHDQYEENTNGTTRLCAVCEAAHQYKPGVWTLVGPPRHLRTHSVLEQLEIPFKRKTGDE